MPPSLVQCQQQFKLRRRQQLKSSSIPAPMPNSRKRSRQQFCQTLTTQTLQYIIATRTVRRCYFNPSIFPPLKQSSPKRQRRSQNCNHNCNHNYHNQVCYLSLSLYIYICEKNCCAIFFFLF